MKKKFELILTNELYDSNMHNVFYYDDLVFNNEKLDTDSSLCLFSERIVLEKSIPPSAYGGILKLIEGAKTKEENEAAWHMRKENDQAIWDAAKEKEKKDKAEKEELIKDYGEDAINFIKKIDDTKTN